MLVPDDVHSDTVGKSYPLDPGTRLPQEGRRPQRRPQTGGPPAPQMCSVRLIRLWGRVIQLFGDFIQLEISSKNTHF